MKNRVLFLFLLFLCTMANAQNIEVSGSQSGTWVADTVFVTGNVKVQDSLKVAPGTTVVFQGFYSIVVSNDASIEAVGTSNDSILFTVADTTGFSVFNAGSGGWNGIRLDKASACKFGYCRFQYGKAALDEDQDGGALRIAHCSEVEIANSTLFCNFSREHGGALNAVWSNVTMHDCKVNNNLTYTRLDTVYFMYGGGLRFLNCEVELTDMVFRNNIGENAIGGALSIDSCIISIDRCIFEHNYGINGGGLYLIRCYDNPCSISNSLFANNISGHFGGGLAISDSSPEISNLTVVNNHSIGVNCGGIFFYQHSSPIVRNCIVYGNTNEVPLEEPIQIWIWTYDNHVPEFHNCLIEFGLENISGNEYVEIYEDCLNEDPVFTDNFHINGSESPCVDAGSPETPPEILNGLDLDKNARVSGNAIDIGAYEVDFTGVNEMVGEVAWMRVVGNPITSSSYAEVDLEGAGELWASLYSLDGKKLCSHVFGRFDAGRHRIEVGEMFTELPQGAYLLVVGNGKRTYAAKVVR